MVNLEYDGTGWSYGVKAISEIYLQEVAPSDNIDSEDTKKFRLLKRKPKTKKMTPKERTKMVILSFPAYCRFKSLLKKLLGGLVMTKMAMKAFGGVLQPNDSTWVSFSRHCFHHPGLTKFDMFCHNKGRLSLNSTKIVTRVKRGNQTAVTSVVASFIFHPHFCQPKFSIAIEIPCNGTRKLMDNLKYFSTSS